VKYRTLFRADNPQFLTEADAAYVTSDLGVTVVIDLRNPEDARESERWPPPGSPIRYENVPFLEGWDMSPIRPGEDPVERLAGTYDWIIANSGSRIVEALTALAQSSNSPAVFHCTAGKDRTGILSALLLELLGVDEPQILEDYYLTNQIIDTLGVRLRSRPGNEHRSPRSFEVPDGLMEQVLGGIRDAHGGVEGYLRSNGLSDATIDQLKQRLLE
jgi:protein-tyrosine phosphatase